jgi:hypothetical protein
MPGSAHPWDGISDDITDWLTSETDYYVDALKMGHRAPFAANTSEKEKRDYYARQVFTPRPDGSLDYSKPNNPGRDILLKRLGIEGYTQVIQSVMPSQTLQQPEEDLEGDTPSDQIDQEMV